MSKLTNKVNDSVLYHISAEPDAGAADSPKQNPKSLNDLLTGEPLVFSKAVPILADVLLSLDAIHSSNRWHVPLQPSAIQLSASGEVKITSQPAGSAPATVVFGGAKYSAPEAFREGAREVPHVASDIYVVALMFYELLAGARVFGAEFSGVDDHSPAAWLNWHTDESKRARALVDLLPGFPSFLSDLLDGMLEKDPERRQFNFPVIAEKLLNASEGTVLVTKPFRSNPLPKQGDFKLNRAWRVVAERLNRFRSKFRSRRARRPGRPPQAEGLPHSTIAQLLFHLVDL
jgi:serine/threonine protein kinase